MIENEKQLLERNASKDGLDDYATLSPIKDKEIKADGRG